MTWAFVVRSWFVAAARFLTLPVESRPVSRLVAASYSVARTATFDAYVSSEAADLRTVPFAALSRFGFAPQRGDRSDLLIQAELCHVNVPVRRWGVTVVRGVNGLEFVSAEVHLTGGSASSSLAQGDPQAYYEGVRQPPPVEQQGVGRDYIGHHDLDGVFEEPGCKVAGILHAQVLLAATFLPVPWRSMAGDDQVAYIVDVDHGGSWSRQRKQSRCRTLPDSGTSGQNERRQHLPISRWRSGIEATISLKDRGL
jgi:hypothetical protein